MLIGFGPVMTVLACLMHWYTSMLYVVPVAAVGGWGWWNARKAGSGRGRRPPTGRPPASPAPPGI